METLVSREFLNEENGSGPSLYYDGQGRSDFPKNLFSITPLNEVHLK